MKNIFAIRRSSLPLVISLFVLLAAASALGQDTLDTVFRPPKGSQVAIVVFEGHGRRGAPAHGTLQVFEDDDGDLRSLGGRNTVSSVSCPSADAAASKTNS